MLKGGGQTLSMDLWVGFNQKFNQIELNLYKYLDDFNGTYIQMGSTDSIIKKTNILRLV